jgi:hypothetical protein
LSREERAINMRNRALLLVHAHGKAVNDAIHEYSVAGMSIQHAKVGVTQRLSIATKAGKVLSVEWEIIGNDRVIAYVPGLWETRLKHQTRGAL